MRLCASVVYVTLSLVGTVLCALPPSDWPVCTNAAGNSYLLRVIKTYGLEPRRADLGPEPGPISPESGTGELQWMHLHLSDSRASSVGLDLRVYNTRNTWAEGLSAAGRNIAVRYTVAGLPVSGWITPSANRSVHARFTLEISNPMLEYVKDGVLDLSVEVTGAGRAAVRPWPSFLHLMRNRTLSPLVPILDGDLLHYQPVFVPVPTRVARLEVRKKGFPALGTLPPWPAGAPPDQAELYLEQLTTATSLFVDMQMWWEDLPSHSGLTFIRGLEPYQGEDPRALDHRTLPMQDGPRGVGWVSSYIQGKVDLQGRLMFAELAGRVGWLLPTGEVVTLAGWVVKAGKNPVWIRKELKNVRANMEMRGSWPPYARPDAAGVGGFGKPMDVAFDPSDPSTVYVPDMGRHCVWRVVLSTLPNANRPAANVTCFAGDCKGGSAGFADGPSALARFNAPMSAVLDPSKKVLYIADSANHAIRMITTEGAATVSTLAGGPTNSTDKLNSAGVGLFSHDQVRGVLNINVTTAEAAGGRRPDIYWPNCMRLRSDGDLVLMEHGTGLIRRISPTTLATQQLASVGMKFSEYDHGWAWMDVDDRGATGPQDGIYWCKAVGEEDYSHFNEVFMVLPPSGGASRFIFTGRGGGANPVMFGARDGTTPPHYAWLVAVDPRGALLVAGIGNHGVSRLRAPAGGDPTATEDGDYWVGWSELWTQGQCRAASAAGWNALFGAGGHNMIGMPDAYSTTNLTDAQLLKFYGATPGGPLGSLPAERQAQFLAYVRKLRGPARDGIPAAPEDRGAPSAPTGVALRRLASAQGCPPGQPAGTECQLLSWEASRDARSIVVGYYLDLATSRTFDSGSIDTRLSGYKGAYVGNVEAVLLEGLPAGGTYWARLRARDLGGALSSFSAPASTTAP